MSQDLRWEFCVLLSGTPVQNNLRELYALLHLVHPAVFPLAAAEDFTAYFANVSRRQLVFSDSPFFSKANCMSSAYLLSI